MTSVLPHSGHWVMRSNGGARIMFHSSLPEAAVNPQRRHSELDCVSVIAIVYMIVDVGNGFSALLSGWLTVQF